MNDDLGRIWNIAVMTAWGRLRKSASPNIRLERYRYANLLGEWTVISCSERRPLHIFENKVLRTIFERNLV
jgi:hypothetical protein